MEGKTVVWESIKNGKEIVRSLKHDADDLLVRDPLDWIIPEDHAEQAFWCGEWDVDGFRYRLENGDTYLVRYYPVTDEDVV